MSALQAQEQRRTLRQDRVTESAFSMHKQQSGKGKKQIYQKNKGKNGSGSSSEGTKQKKFSPCMHCKKTTHAEKYCQWKPDATYGNCKQLGHITKVCKFKTKDFKPQQTCLVDVANAQEE